MFLRILLLSFNVIQSLRRIFANEIAPECVIFVKNE